MGHKLEARLHRFYELHNPTKLKDVEIMAATCASFHRRRTMHGVHAVMRICFSRFEDNEPELNRKLYDKYEQDLRSIPKEDSKQADRH